MSKKVYVVLSSYVDMYGETTELFCVCATRELAEREIKLNGSKDTEYTIVEEEIIQ